MPGTYNSIPMIRPYQPNDHAALIALIRENTPTYFAKAEAAEFSQYLEAETEDYFIVEAGGQIVGCGGINYEPEKNAAVLSWDIIHPEYQGKGYGRQLTHHRIALIRQKPGIDRIIVRTSQHTELFYGKMGFTTQKVAKDYWSPGFDLYYMVRPV